MSNNVMAEQLLVTTYQQIGTLISQRADIDMKLLTLHSKVGSIVAQAAGNVLAIESESVSGTSEVEPVKPKAKAKPKVKKVEPEVMKGIVNSEEYKAEQELKNKQASALVEHMQDLTDVAEDEVVTTVAEIIEDSGEVMSFEAVNALVQQVAGEKGQSALAWIATEGWGPYKVMDDEKKLKFSTKIQGILS